MNVKVYMSFERLQAIANALRLAQACLEQDVEACGNCDGGDGSTGKDEHGDPCDGCSDQRAALAAVRQVLE